MAKTRSYAAENLDFRPFFLNFEEFAHAADALVGLSALAQLLVAPHLDTDSTLIDRRSDAYADALLVYQYAKMLATQNISGVQAASKGYKVPLGYFPAPPGY